MVTFFLYNKYKLILRTEKEAIVVDELKSCTRKHNHIAVFKESLRTGNLLLLLNEYGDPSISFQNSNFYK